MQDIFVSNQSQLTQLCENIRDAECIGIDTEFLRDKTYYAKLCLIQLATEKVIACVDPLAVDDLSPLMEIFYDNRCVKIMHSARQDLEIFFDIAGKLPEPLFDTQIAATLLGYGDQLGYAKLVKSMMSVNLDKAQSRTDWSQRPLDDSQIQYALDDVRYLIPIYDKQLELLRQKNREDWLEVDFNRLTDLSLYSPDPEKLWLRVKGAKNLKGVQLAVLQKLSVWREELAKQLDRPRRWLLSDDILVELARRQPGTVEAIEKLRACNNQVKRNAAELVEQIKVARDLPQEQWPVDSRPESLTMEQDAKVDLLMSIIRVRALKNDVTPAVLATRRDLEKMVVGETDVDILRGWRFELVGKELQDFLAGKETIYIKDNQINIDIKS